MSLYTLYETDSDLEQGGVILNYEEGVRLKIARAGGANTKYAKSLERITRPYRRKDGTMMHIEDDIATEMYCRVYAESVVVDWEGVTDRDGNLMEFSVENCVRLFTDLPDLFADVRNAADGIENFKMDQLEGEVKN
jgi:hypothetical protein